MMYFYAAIITHQVGVQGFVFQYLITSIWDYITLDTGNIKWYDSNTEQHNLTFLDDFMFG